MRPNDGDYVRVEDRRSTDYVRVTQLVIQTIVLSFYIIYFCTGCNFYTKQNRPQEDMLCFTIILKTICALVIIGLDIAFLVHMI